MNYIISIMYLEVFDTKDVTEWYEALIEIDIPSLQHIFSGLFTHIMILDFGYNNTIAIAEPFMSEFCSLANE